MAACDLPDECPAYCAIDGCDCQREADHSPVITVGNNICGWPDVCCTRCEAEEGAEADRIANGANTLADTYALIDRIAPPEAFGDTPPDCPTCEYGCDC